MLTQIKARIQRHNLVKLTPLTSRTNLMRKSQEVTTNYKTEPIVDHQNIYVENTNAE